MSTQASRSEATGANPPLWQVAAAVAWLLVFAGCFYQFDLPNSSPRVNRTEVWRQLPSLLINMVDPPPPAADDIEARQLWKHAGWRFWPQRFGMYGVSLAILAGAWGWGSLALRLMRVSTVLRRPAILKRGTTGLASAVPHSSGDESLGGASAIPSLNFDRVLGAWSLERLFFALTSGLAVVSLWTLGCGLAGCLSRTVAGAILLLGPIVELVLCLSTRRIESGSVTGCASLSSRIRQLWPLLLLVPFLMVYVGGAFLPETDFDVKEYHFGGPKEWYLAGKITFLPHNVYTSFPFLTEMLTLLGIVLYGDWYWGAVAGKGVLMAFAPLTALGLFIAGRRWFSPQAGLWAAVIHLSTPWIYRISIIAYAEGGLTCYLFAALLAVLFYVESIANKVPSATTNVPSDCLAWVVLAGFLAGSGMACKYPGVVSVVIPLGLALLVSTYRQRRQGADSQRDWRAVLTIGLVFSLGVAFAIGPWLLKNLAETGNPVYPLLYGVFGATDWNAELNAKWKHGHSPEHHQLGDLAIKLMDVTLKSDWLSPLLFGLAPLALLAGRRRLVRELWLYVAFLFATWWLLTHRIDRFWVPLIPVVALLAGVGATWTPQRAWRKFVLGFAICAGTFNFAFMTTSLCGYNAYLLDLNRAAEQTARITAPEVVTLNSLLTPASKVLCVGEAELFDARFPYVYNTVFDVSIFEEWCGVPESSGGAARRPLKPVADIRRIFREQGITHVYVNWQEILRYRLTYGYTDFVTPRRFQELQAAGILDAEWQLPGGQLFDKMDARSREEVQRWGPELIRRDSGPAIFRTFDVFPLKP